MRRNFKKVLIVIAIVFVLAVALGGGVIVDKFLPNIVNTNPIKTPVSQQTYTGEENNVINIVRKSSPSVVTVSGTASARPTIQFNPFNGGLSQGQVGGEGARYWKWFYS